MSLEDHINTFLPPTIRVWTILRVQGAFNPRSSCDQRQYEYTLPTHVFLGPKPGTPMATWMQKTRAATLSARDSIPPTPTTTSTTVVPPLATSEATTESAPSEPSLPETETPLAPPATVLTETELANDAAFALSDAFWAAQAPGSTADEDLIARRAWRISAPVVDSVRAFVKAYEGSHNYCGFTVGKEYRDRSNQRVMKKLTVSEPFVVGEVEYISVGFLGQSFMLHQIVSC